jgi:hypothetical protein
MKLSGRRCYAGQQRDACALRRGDGRRPLLRLLGVSLEAPPPAHGELQLPSLEPWLVYQGALSALVAVECLPVGDAVIALGSDR